MSDKPENFVAFDRGYSFSVTVTSREIVSLTVPTIYDGFFGLSHATPDGNRVDTYQNQVLVFEGGPAVPAGAAPVGTAAADPNGGTIVYPAVGTFTAQPCLCAYAVGPPVTTGGTTTYPNIAATAYLPQGSATTTLIQTAGPALDVQTAQTAFIVWKYALPPGVAPGACGAWIGLWVGGNPPYGSPPDYAAPVTGTQSSGMAAMPRIHLTGNMQYTGALLTSGYSATTGSLQTTAIAAVLMFKTGPPQSG